MVDIKLMFFGGENITLNQWTLPGTMSMSWVGFDTQAHLWLHQCVFVRLIWEGNGHISASVCVTATLLPHVLLASVCACLCLHKPVCVYGVTVMWSTCPLHPRHAALRRLLSWNLPDDIIKRWQGRQVRAPVVAAGKGYYPTCVSVRVWVHICYIFILIFMLALELVPLQRCSDWKQSKFCLAPPNLMS